MIKKSYGLLTDQQTDRPTDRWTEWVRVMCMWLKTVISISIKILNILKVQLHYSKSKIFSTLNFEIQYRSKSFLIQNFHRFFWNSNKKCQKLGIFLEIHQIFIFESEISAWSVLSTVLRFSQYLRLGMLINEVLIKKKKCIVRDIVTPII